MVYRKVTFAALLVASLLIMALAFIPHTARARMLSPNGEFDNTPRVAVPKITAPTPAPLPVFGEDHTIGGLAWPVNLDTGDWYDASPYGFVYGGCRHTGADINLRPGGSIQADIGQPVFSIANGVVTFAGSLPVWHNIIIVRHTLSDNTILYARYAHVADLQVAKDDPVVAGQQVAVIAGPQDYSGTPHLHFDLSLTSILQESPGTWPCMSDRLFVDFINPVSFLEMHTGIKPQG